MHWQEELYHHGIIGQKWGIRRFQNRDGSLTPEGRERYGKLAGKYRDTAAYNLRQTMKKEALKTAGVSDDGITIAKGSKIHRTSTRGDEQLGARMYGSVTERDRGLYSRMGTYDYEYTATKAIKIASCKQVAESVIAKYGDKKLTKIAYATGMGLFDWIKNGKYYNMTLAQITDGLDWDDMQLLANKAPEGVKLDRFEKDLQRRSRIAWNATKQQFDDAMKKTSQRNGNMSTLLRDFQNQGYGGVIDINDSSWTDMPIIFMDPASQMERTNVAHRNLRG